MGRGIHSETYKGHRINVRVWSEQNAGQRIGMFEIAPCKHSGHRGSGGFVIDYLAEDIALRQAKRSVDEVLQRTCRHAARMRYAVAGSAHLTFRRSRPATALCETGADFLDIKAETAHTLLDLADSSSDPSTAARRVRLACQALCSIERYLADFQLAPHRRTSIEHKRDALRVRIEGMALS